MYGNFNSAYEDRGMLRFLQLHHYNNVSTMQAIQTMKKEMITKATF